MKKTNYILFFILSSIVLLAGCNSKSKSVELSINDAGKTIHLNTGDSVVLNLTGNPTTGYSWEIADVDASILEPQGEAEYKSSSDLIGAEGTFTFTFKALQTGTTNLRLEYLRPWENDTEPIDSFLLTFEVK